MSRELVLARVRAALGHPKPGDGARVRAAAARLEETPRSHVPSRARLSQTECLAAFRSRLEAQHVLVEGLGSAAEVPPAVARLLEAARLPQVVRMGSAPYLTALPWGSDGAPEAVCGAAAPHDEAAISHALSGVAETGTLVLASGLENPVTLSFLPALHIVVVEKDAIVGALEDAFDLVRARFGRHGMPRTLNLISSASRTGDIGGKLVMGAHGPRQLVVLVAGK